MYVNKFSLRPVEEDHQKYNPNLFLVLMPFVCAAQSYPPPPSLFVYVKPADA